MDSKQAHLRPETIAITAGRPEVGADSALNPPISLNSTYVAGGPIGYGRYGNETWSALESAISALEGAGRCWEKIHVRYATTRLGQ